jgi:ubiquinone/menaquinone biosynthesis C-methylase UbiE
MAHETAAANRVALDLLDLQPGEQVLEIGFGHGRTLASAMARIADGFVAGIDHSELMLRIARKRNASWLLTGRMEPALGDSEHLPYPDRRFNKTFAMHTIYFWPDPRRHFKEAARVLSDDGCLLVGYRPSDDLGFAEAFPSSVYRMRSIKHVESLIAEAGLHRVQSTARRLSSSLFVWTLAHKSPSSY